MSNSPPSEKRISAHVAGSGTCVAEKMMPVRPTLEKEEPFSLSKK